MMIAEGVDHHDYAADDLRGISPHGSVASWYSMASRSTPAPAKVRVLAFRVIESLFGEQAVNCVLKRLIQRCSAPYLRGKSLNRTLVHRCCW